MTPNFFDTTPIKTQILGAPEKAQRVKESATKLEDLSSIPQAHMW